MQRRFQTVRETANWIASPARRPVPDGPRVSRPLAVGEPEVHDVAADDGAQLRLTRYQGGTRGPVLLSHCIGVSSRMYATDTIEPNLLEFLYARGFDVWLLDHRFSIELPLSQQRSSMDDVATRDYPAAVASVRDLSGQDSIQVVAHGVGASTFTMAMLAGLTGVRAAVCSQVSTHLLVPALNRVKTSSRSTEMLSMLGADTVTAYVDEDAGWTSRLYDRSLRLYPIRPEERCDSPVCHRISAIYGELYRHARLSEATHSALHELFGVVNLSALSQLAKLTRAGHLVNADGQNTYLPHAERLAIPLLLLHGGDNECVSPRSTELTLELLSRRNGPELYRRELIPGYGHVDCMIGEHAARDVFPYIAEHLEATA
jgi:cholesterol oxidase